MNARNSIHVIISNRFVQLRSKSYRVILTKIIDPPVPRLHIHEYRIVKRTLKSEINLSLS